MRDDLILKYAEQNNIDISRRQVEQLSEYQDMVLDVNRSMNLTAITDNVDFAVKHIIDSMTVLPYLPQKAALIDIGTGAGFPGMIIKIMRPDVRVSLLDGTRKRVHFLEETAMKLGLDVDCIHARAEEYCRKDIVGSFDVAVARAVAKLDVLGKYCLPYVKSGGLLIAMKGSDIGDEVEKSKPALMKKGGSVKEIVSLIIGAGIDGYEPQKRNLVLIQK